MTRSELIQKISVQNPHLYITDVERLAMTIINTMKKSLMDGRKIELRSFGVFGLKFKKASLARNPMTGEKVNVPDRAKIFFRTGKELKDKINRA